MLAAIIIFFLGVASPALADDAAPVDPTAVAIEAPPETQLEVVAPAADPAPVSPVEDQPTETDKGTDSTTDTTNTEAVSTVAVQAEAVTPENDQVTETTEMADAPDETSPVTNPGRPVMSELVQLEQTCVGTTPTLEVVTQSTLPEGVGPVGVAISVVYNEVIALGTAGMTNAAGYFQYVAPLAEPGSYDVNVVVDGSYVGDKVLVVTDSTCNDAQPVDETNSDTYVILTNPSAIGGVGTGTVSFDYDLVDGVDGAIVTIVISPADHSDAPVWERTDEAVVFEGFEVTGPGTFSKVYDLPAGEYVLELVRITTDTTSFIPRVVNIPFTVLEETTEPEEPTEIGADKAPVSGNVISIPDKDGIEYFDDATGETLTGDVTIIEGGITIDVRSTDPYKTVTGGPWFYEYLPNDRSVYSYEKYLDCTAQAWYKQKYVTNITYIRDADDKVIQVANDRQVFSEPKKLDREVTPEELAEICPVTDPTEPTDNPSDTTVTPGPAGDDTQKPARSDSQTKGDGKSAALAVTGSTVSLGALGAAGALALVGAFLVRRDRRRDSVQG